MITKKTTPLSQLSLTALAFGLPLAYWVYLILTSQTEIKWDSFDYERLGQMLYHQGWEEFFRTGPNREPLYPLLISLAMRLADMLHLPYLKILVIMQFAFLALTQLFCLKILQRLNINRTINAFAVFYIGVSPALLNCALSLYSEILIIAFIPASILIFSTTLKNISKYNIPQTILAGTVLALTLIIPTFTKGIFEMVGPAILISSLLIISRIAPKPGANKGFLLMFLIALLLFWSVLFGYKTLNKNFNGHFTLTDRGAWALYGFSARRVEPMPKQRIMAGIAFIPGEGSCKKFFSDEQCYFWSFYNSDAFSFNKLKELIGQGYEKEALDKELIRLSVEKIRSAPFQYSMLTLLEGFKVFFWETTKLGFVIYPDWLERLYDISIFKDLLRLCWAVLSLAGLGYGFYFFTLMWKNKMAHESFITLFVILCMILFYTAIHALFQLGPRYTVPIGPLFLCLISLFASQTIKRPRQ